ncbi:MAG: hypothetical protein JSS02_26835 [Planctomycetes bacterium]|nr:hypothetical protein [Planctomycetota bacterium]
MMDEEFSNRGWYNYEGEPESGEKEKCPMCGTLQEPSWFYCHGCGEKRADTPQVVNFRTKNVWRDGRRLVLVIGTRLPAKCVKTNQLTTERVSQAVYWHPNWVYLSLFVPPLCLLLILITQRRIVIDAGLSPEIKSRRQVWKFIGWFLLVGGLISSFSCFLPLPLAPEDKVMFIPLGAMMLAGSFGVYAFVVQLFRPAKVKAGCVWLEGVHPDYLVGLPRFPGEEHLRYSIVD